MKVFVQVINSKTFSYQHEMIDEPVMEGLEINNALKHLGITYGNIIWISNIIDKNIPGNPKIMTGYIEDTTKIVTVVAILN